MLWLAPELAVQLKSANLPQQTVLCNCCTNPLALASLLASPGTMRDSEVLRGKERHVPGQHQRPYRASPSSKDSEQGCSSVNSKHAICCEHVGRTGKRQGVTDLGHIGEVCSRVISQMALEHVISTPFKSCQSGICCSTGCIALWILQQPPRQHSNSGGQRETILDCACTPMSLLSVSSCCADDA